jgi:acetylornithine deacetylase
MPADFTNAERRILDAIDEEALVAELVDLIRVPSITGTDGESDLQHRHAAQLAELGFAVDVWKLDLADLAAHPDYPGTEAARAEGYGVVGTLGPDGPAALVLQAHVDVVPTGDLEKWGSNRIYDLYRDRIGGVWGLRKGGRGEPTWTGYNIVV